MHAFSNLTAYDYEERAARGALYEINVDTLVSIATLTRRGRQRD